MNAIPDRQQDSVTLRKSLLQWYDQHRRNLPWRNDPSLYGTVISEFMLQQTQVATVIPYYLKWMDAFPDFETLAAASETTILKSWEGLGYYSRARNLHRLARIITSRQSKPTTYEEWLTLPGIGPYTAAAIASIALGEVRAVVDGNVARVLNRLHGDKNRYPDSGTLVKAYRPVARELIDPERPGDFNQALMELGALLCRPRSPDCPSCPWRHSCKSHLTDDPSALPLIKKKSIARKSVQRLFHRRISRGVPEILLEKIPENARRLAGQYQLPRLPEGMQTPRAEPLLVRSRGISNERIRESIYAAPPAWPPKNKKMLQEGLHWIPVSRLDSITIPGPHRQWINLLLERERNSGYFHAKK